MVMAYTGASWNEFITRESSCIDHGAFGCCKLYGKFDKFLLPIPFKRWRIDTIGCKETADTTIRSPTKQLQGRALLADFLPPAWWRWGANDWNPTTSIVFTGASGGTDVWWNGLINVRIRNQTLPSTSLHLFILRLSGLFSLEGFPR